MSGSMGVPAGEKTQVSREIGFNHSPPSPSMPAPHPAPPHSCVLMGSFCSPAGREMRRRDDLHPDPSPAGELPEGLFLVVAAPL